MIEGMSLKPFNSFAIDVLAQHVVMVHTEAELLTQWRLASAGERPVLVLGGGSNVLFLENYEGTVLLNRIRGITVSEDTLAWHLHVGAGEVWHDLVTTCLDCHMPGLENLALIPGYVGSAPIQNIGAYGVELHQLCEYVDVLMLETGKKQRLNAAECHFGYRDSIFKHGLRNNCAIVAVGLRLRKAWQSVLNHGDLSHLDTQHTTPRQIYDAVCTIRRRKLPDLAVTGNAGSFFKNPVIDASMAAKLLSQYPEAPYYPQEPGGGGKVKLAAGWLIDHCGLKGYQLGGAAVHSKQALILINAAQATGGDIAALARYVRQQVADKFAIWLEPEVRFIGTCGEVDAVGVLS